MKSSIAPLLFAASLAVSGCATPPPEVAANLSPEEVLKKIEKTVADATTIKAEFKIDKLPLSKDGKVVVSASGILELKGANKVLVQAEIRQGSQKMDWGLVSDGKRHFAFSGNSSSPPSEPPKALAAEMRAHFSTLPLLAMWMGPRIEGFQDRRNSFQVIGVRSGEDDGSQKTLWVEYQSQDPNGVKPQARLWYDPKTFLISKRVMTGGRADTPIELPDTFFNIVLNADIPDDDFSMPEEK
jgi:hypothetical protein